MRIVHNISVNSSARVRAELARLDFVVPDRGLIRLCLDEEDVRWPGLRAWAKISDALHRVETKFSDEEIDTADWLALLPQFVKGYPSPDGNATDYLKNTYDLSGYCSECGVGKKQNAPFRINGRIKWGRNGIVQLNWVFDEYFVRPEIWREIFDPMGIRSLPVLTRGGREMDDIVQLVISEEVELASGGLSSQVCGVCGRAKYKPIARGPWPRLGAAPASVLARSKQVFGGGPSAFNEIIVSGVVRDALRTANVRGVQYAPMPVG
ncbi:MAG: hypothetical protein IT548_05045 [Alphaproteobacteria bacterium]|nr:hypothetical protein [Alphaproteobacteria bacterium]